jgi:hypothetical protein
VVDLRNLNEEEVEAEGSPWLARMRAAQERVREVWEPLMEQFASREACKEAERRRQAFAMIEGGRDA